MEMPDEKMVITAKVKALNARVRLVIEAHFQVLGNAAHAGRAVIERHHENGREHMAGMAPSQ